ncbi:MAG TPA: hypothetical protein VLG28_01540 [Acidimicrobiia bacterium]|nr:hypothetical protein [Acidimicrobiia bacterium]
MAIDIAGFITYLKDHAVEHGFHVHDERHFIETYSLRQSFEVDLHPESACTGPLDLNLAFDVEPRVLLKLEDTVNDMDAEFIEPEGEFRIPLYFNWGLPPLGDPPNLVILSAELAGVGGHDLPIEVSAVDSFGALSQEPERRLSLVGRVEVSLVDVMMGRETLCDTLDRCREVSEYLVVQADEWKVVELPPPAE